MPEQGMDKKRCFIITPIGNDNDSIRRHIDGIIDAAINRHWNRIMRLWQLIKSQRLER